MPIFKVVPGKNDLLTLYPEIASELAPEYDPSALSAHSNQIVDWICKNGHRWKDTVTARTQDGAHSCPFCARSDKYISYERSIVSDPILSSEYSGDNPLPADQIARHSDRSVIWKCRKNPQHLWTQTPYNRSKGYGCPYCSGWLADPGRTDLATVFPEIAKEYDPANPLPVEQISAHSHKRVGWICPKGHHYTTTVATRVIARRSGCPYCEHRLPIKGKTDLLTLRPEIAAFWSPENDKRPDEVNLYSSYIAKWRCGKGHTWTQAVHIRVKAHTECPICYIERRYHDHKDSCRTKKGNDRA